ncbi:DUF2935 family protein [Tumebacillus sp. BK434]|uniref:DUF2935 domain-containing protein n=1 Tax=Tumebacillus sp. BK434 TaxID=2512169 RepID=UPI00104CA16B|nr:DUF2935 domain-containing protein [Tumebacillus sp. BK434]TCP55741.1 DUF2935 family protein [Tumebacillus sp. BK434]
MHDYQHAALFEHRFWLQVLGDHARFFQLATSAKEMQDVQQINRFIVLFDQLMETARCDLSRAELMTLNHQAAELVKQFRAFKLHVQRRQLTGEIAVNLPPTFINHMVNELDEYTRILNSLLQGNLPPVYHPVHHHLLWLADATGHADGLAAFTDMSEKMVIAKAKSFSKHFTDLYLKAVEMAGFLRTGLQDFPPLARFNREAELEMLLFQEFLTELEELELDHSLLSILSPLMPDHMFREECYYLTKLSQVAGVKKPACDPTQPRVTG